jgi:hypothetical protein
MLDKKFLFDAIFGQVVFGLMVIGKADFENSKFEGEQSAEDALLSFCCREWSRLSVWAASWQRVASKHRAKSVRQMPEAAPAKSSA